MDTKKSFSSTWVRIFLLKIERNYEFTFKKTPKTFLCTRMYQFWEHLSRIFRSKSVKNYELWNYFAHNIPL